MRYLTILCTAWLSTSCSALAAETPPSVPLPIQKTSTEKKRAASKTLPTKISTDKKKSTPLIDMDTELNEKNTLEIGRTHV